jgi:hypothetical protein
LERQYDLTPRYVHPVVDEDQLSINTAGTAGTLLLKLHGDLRHPNRPAIVSHFASVVPGYQFHPAKSWTLFAVLQ